MNIIEKNNLMNTKKQMEKQIEQLKAMISKIDILLKNKEEKDKKIVRL